MDAQSIKLIHQGNFLSYYEINYTDGEGHSKTYEMVSKTGSKFNKTPELTLDTLGINSGAVITVVLNKDHSKILMSKEKRLGVNRYVYNNVAGLIDPGETVEQAAERELREETGLKLIKIIKAFKPSFTCAPVTDEMAYLVICEAEGEITGSDSIYEEIHARWVDKQEALKIIDNDDETAFSGRTQAIVYMWATGGKL